MTDSEINEKVARKLGWEKIQEEDEFLKSKGISTWRKKGFTGYVMPGSPPPDFCNRIEAAFEILNAWKGDWDIIRENGQFACYLYRPSEEFEEWANTAPRAICEAFLKLP